MRPSPSSLLRRRLGVIGVPALGLLLAATLSPAASQSPSALDPTPDPDSFSFSFQDEEPERPQSADLRGGSVAVTAEQRSAAAAMGATSARWNRFGTPHVLFNTRGYLSAPRSGTAAEVARDFVRANETLFKLSEAEVAALELVTDSPLYDSPDLARARDGIEPRNPDVAHVVTFRQTFGDLVAAHDGLLTLGVQDDGRIAWASSSVTGDDTVSGTQALSAVAALQKAAADAELDLGDLSEVGVQGPWTTFASTRSGDLQRARLMALPTPTDGVRVVWETTLLASDHAEHEGEGHAPAAYITFVDAETGEILLRDERVDHAAEGLSLAGGATTSLNLAAAPSGEPFSGSTADAGACTPQPHGPFAVDEGTGSIDVVVAVTSPNGADDDIVINLYRAGQDAPVASQDLLTSPEVMTYSPSGGVPAGDYSVEVCEFAPADGSIGYEGSFFASPVGGGGGVPTPRWRVFESNPNFTDSARPSKDTRQLWCWINDSSKCKDATYRNTASRVPWDVMAPSSPTFTTQGNNATTAISEFSFLTPDTPLQRPFTPDRVYDYEWRNAWFDTKCDPTSFDNPSTGRNDADASVANLFTMHNRMHDWSYYLGFTELNSNLQSSNFGNTGPSRENDPEVGNAQAGRRTFNGRDNANQITLQDGIAPITNQYLWQPLAGAFYAACTDGAYDMAVVAHEYGHAISNRMVAGPDTGTGPTQGQTESWSDLIFAEYFRGNVISTGKGANPYALAPYVSGNKQRGIRNYAMNKSPLNYSDLEYDANGTTSPHADGEIWSAVNFDISRALNRKWDSRYPSSNVLLQRRCAKGKIPANRCPGNRRWAQIMFDGLLLTPTGSTMLDSRDAMLAADRLRFHGSDQAVMWKAFARRGMGHTAVSKDAEDRQPRPGWSSPMTRSEATVRFVSPAKRTRVYVGMYEARISPTADNIGKTRTPSKVKFVPGRYKFIAQAPGHGAVRFARTFRPGQDLKIRVPLRRNLASVHNGAKAKGDGINLTSLIDDTEATNWASLESAGTASEGKGEGRQVEGRQVTVKLADPGKIDRVQVSAALRPVDVENKDSASQSRFSALRSFRILVCREKGAGACSDTGDFRPVLRSGANAFPGVRPRPTAPDLTLRGFRFDPVRATHVRIQVVDNQCTGGPAYQGKTNQVNDPVFSNPDCDSEEMTPDRAVLNPPQDQVRIAELQVFRAARRS